MTKMTKTIDETDESRSDDATLFIHASDGKRLRLKDLLDVIRSHSKDFSCLIEKWENEPNQ